MPNTVYNICCVGQRGGGARSHHRVCWPYHTGTSKHMAHSVRKRTLENKTEMMILVCIAVQAAVQLRGTNAASMKAQWARAAPALHTHHFLLLTLCLRVQCETGVCVASLRVYTACECVSLRVYTACVCVCVCVCFTPCIYSMCVCFTPCIYSMCVCVCVFI